MAVSLTETVTHQVKDITLPFKDRIKLLKFDIHQRGRHISNEEVTTLVNENIDYVEINAITPIKDSDELKIDEKFKLRQLKTTTTTIQPWDTTNKNAIGRQNNDNYAGYKALKTAEKPVETFYRKLLLEDKMTKPIQWVHCQDMITPYFRGMKKELGPRKRVTAEDRTVIRLLELLGTNTTGFDYQDVRSLMYHINDMKIRLFQWDIAAIRLLFNTISPKKKHTFRTLKHSIQAMFKRWHLDYHDTKKLLLQTRLFRPPCVDSNYRGSTKSSKVSRYIKSTTPTTTADNDDDCDD